MLRYKLRALAFISCILLCTVALAIDYSMFADFKNSTSTNKHNQKTPIKSIATAISSTVRYIAGDISENGVITLPNGRLVRDIYENTQALENSLIAQNKIIELCKEINRRIAVVIIPSAEHIFSDMLPMFFNDEVFNERHRFETLYKELSANALGINIYPTFTNAKRDSLYMLTEDSITSVAGYTVYSELALRLGYTPIRFENFRLQQLSKPYIGSLWTDNLVHYPSPDYISYLSPNDNPPVIVTLGRGDNRTVYTTLYPEQAAVLGSEINVILGGENIQTSILSLSPNTPNRTLTIFGDSSAYPVLPFLSKHYREIAFHNLSVQGLPQPNILGDDIVLLLSAGSLSKPELSTSLSFITKYISSSAH